MEIIWTQEAARQLEVLAGHYRLTLGSAAAKTFVQRLLEAVAALSGSPHNGRYLVRRGQAYRDIVVPPFAKVVYRVVGAKVMIVGVWDGRRDTPDA